MTTFLRIALALSTLYIASAIGIDRAVSQNASAQINVSTEDGFYGRRDSKHTYVPGGAIGKDRITPYIFNGKPSHYDDVFGISYKKEDGLNYICSGTLIGPHQIITAGHCGCGIKSSYQVTNSANIRSASKWFSVKEVLLFDGYYCGNDKIIGNDLAILILNADPKGPTHRLRHLIPHPMASVASWPATFRALGYGLTEKSGWGLRLEAHIPVLSINCADKQFTKRGCTPFVEMILADRRPSGTAVSDTCGGDSGGPIMAQLPGDPKARLVGVTSRGMGSDQQSASLHCGGGGIYTVLGRYSVARWLDSLGIDKSDPTPSGRVTE
ncbi:trypsin-like serine protease [Bosea sp. TND4EK4]|uniref:trypsin-like serine protease n=1 Tax=Bosea sp. TND4EK4 TaxID=1907408 RepID=UPI0009542C0F|nr:trypsin-like serine protease [Bosea sp. TND4EK4]SIQ61435.1 Trypsin [Bosea sp. TND4EK4]